jgi:GTP cyclohydrolase I
MASRQTSSDLARYDAATDTDSGESYDPEFEALVRTMLVRIGEDPDREGLRRTPLRVAKAMDFLTSGYSQNANDVVSNAVFHEDGKEMVVVRDIEFYSLCEHHMLPFFGHAHVGYLPDGKVVGLSKIARLVDVYARRLQVQERLTTQIADGLMNTLDALGVGVVLEASHTCMMMRGVQKQKSSTITSAMRGNFESSGRRRAIPRSPEGRFPDRPKGDSQIARRAIPRSPEGRFPPAALRRLDAPTCQRLQPWRQRPIQTWKERNVTRAGTHAPRGGQPCTQRSATRRPRRGLRRTRRRCAGTTS